LLFFFLGSLLPLTLPLALLRRLALATPLSLTTLTGADVMLEAAFRLACATLSAAAPLGRGLELTMLAGLAPGPARTLATALATALARTLAPGPGPGPGPARTFAAGFATGLARGLKSHVLVIFQKVFLLSARTFLSANNSTPLITSEGLFFQPPRRVVRVPVHNFSTRTDFWTLYF